MVHIPSHQRILKITLWILQMKNNLKLGFFVFAVALAACGEKQPPTETINCSSPSATEYVLTAFSKKVVEEGARGFAGVEVGKALSISSITALEKNESTGEYKCRANIAINYPPELADRIAASFSDEENRENLREKLETRLGIVNGAGVFNQLNALVSDGPHGFVPSIISKEDTSKYNDVILKNTRAIFGELLVVPVGYEITPKRDADGKLAHEIKFYVHKRDALDANVVILNLQGLI